VLVGMLLRSGRGKRGIGTELPPRTRLRNNRRPAGRRRLTCDEITSLVTALDDVMRVLRDADPADKAEVYSRLGLTPLARVRKRVSGGDCTKTTPPVLRACA
jgi:hypothetical protein